MSEELKLFVKLLNPQANPPVRSTAEAAGYDLYALEEVKIPARGQASVKTGISLKIPAGYYGRIAPRSGLAAKHSIDVGAGVIDCDYRGEIIIILFNHSQHDLTLQKNDRAAQIIIEKIATPAVIVVDELDDTARGVGGFGSTGI